ncbi:hypothetical protein [Caulobacter sp. 602-1]|uniref:hypothetical protein n=1 Tax=Caulobacter sp. 602-1 TaxID=2492472 RepID=UPI000F6437D9|nr:hypothetical protein [Caulobacter sp. 602-1]RRN65046.1 hypothetical protein EIK80_05600 [Caulobacter sp. 602-1]
MRAIVLGLSAALVLAASGASAADHPNPEGEAKLAKLLEGRVAGKPVHCINLRATDSSEIIEGTAIVYKGPGGRLYVNRPRGGADSLRRDDILVTKTVTSQLCNIDVVTLVDPLARFPRGFVNLGDFVPYAKPGKP